jgi:hypothetical protein
MYLLNIQTLCHPVISDLASFPVYSEICQTQVPRT